jgi:hypothetical protein
VEGLESLDQRLFERLASDIGTRFTGHLAQTKQVAEGVFTQMAPHDGLEFCLWALHDDTMWRTDIR